MLLQINKISMRCLKTMLYNTSNSEANNMKHAMNTSIKVGYEIIAS